MARIEDDISKGAREMQYDDIIVGAGSSGAVVAVRLSEDPNRSVLLLEAGPDYRTIEETPHDLLHSMLSLAKHDWGWTARATQQREIAYTRGKVTGGCSAVNASVAIRGAPADFDEWVALGQRRMELWESAALLSKVGA